MLAERIARLVQRRHVGPSPTATTDDDVRSPRSGSRRSFGAQSIVMPPDRHDTLVAVVSHVPHLTAATLMRLADGRARWSIGPSCGSRPASLRHDPDRGGSSAIWPDICAQNQVAITDVLDELILELGRLRAVAGCLRHRAVAGSFSRRLGMLAGTCPPLRPRHRRWRRCAYPCSTGNSELVAIAYARRRPRRQHLRPSRSPTRPKVRGVVVVLVEAALRRAVPGGLMVQGRLHDPAARLTWPATPTKGSLGSGEPADPRRLPDLVPDPASARPRHDDRPPRVEEHHQPGALVTAALAAGTTELQGVLFADDTDAMIGGSARSASTS
ncbi:MAG: prephenate dehydrogenase dimerization domain-containing protein [Acidimicrobiales bacterium]